MDCEGERKTGRRGEGEAGGWTVRERGIRGKSFLQNVIMDITVSLASTAVNLGSLCISVCGWILVCVYL